MRPDLGVFVVDNGEAQPFPGEHASRAETFTTGALSALSALDEAASWFGELDAYRRHGRTFPDGASTRWICRLGVRP